MSEPQSLFYFLLFNFSLVRNWSTSQSIEYLDQKESDQVECMLRNLISNHIMIFSKVIITNNKFHSQDLRIEELTGLLATIFK
jgi:hypothetical protein